MIYQMLTPGTLAEIGQVEEVVFKRATQPAMKMNSMMVGMMRGQMEKNSVFEQPVRGSDAGG